MNDQPERNPASAEAIPPAMPRRPPPPPALRDPYRDEHDGHEREGRGLNVGTAFAIGLAALAVGAVAYGTLAPRRRENRPPDDAEPRLRHDGAWDGNRAVAGKSVLINRPRDEVYRFYRDLANQPRFMGNVREVTGSDTRSTWTMVGLVGDVDVEVEIVEDRPNERIAWRSAEGASFSMEGHVEFRDAPAGRGTYVVLEMDYRPPAGALGRGVAELTRRSPSTEARHGLKRLKMLLETGEIATSARRKENSDQEEAA